eukprot:jgi/Botrbrau1/22847/Bobra.0065s0006.1
MACARCWRMQCGHSDPLGVVAVARELTKLHEEVWRGTLEGAFIEFTDRLVKGEVTLVVEGAPASGDLWPLTQGGDAAGSRGKKDRWEIVKEEVEALLREGVSVMSASRTVAKKYGLPRGRLQARVALLQDSIQDPPKEEP